MSCSLTYAPQSVPGFSENSKDLKSCFASAPVLIQPDPASQFVVGVGCLGKPQLMIYFNYVFFFFFFPVGFLLLREIMILVTGNFLLLIWLLKNGVTGWLGAAQSLFIWKYQKNLSYISPQSHPDLILSTACFAASIN